MQIKKVLVTVPLAKQWLENQRTNRGLSDDHANALAREITGGRWCPEQAPIRFDQEGRLWDGQHRLRAVILAGIPVYMMVQHGCSEEVIRSHGLTRPRTVQDQLRIDGMPSNLAKSMTSLARMLQYRRKAGFVPLSKKGSAISVGGVAELLEWAGITLEEMYRIDRDGQNAYNLRRDIGLAPSEWVYLYAQRAPGFSAFADGILRSECPDESQRAFVRYCAGMFSSRQGSERRKMLALVKCFENRDLKKFSIKEDDVVVDLIGSVFPIS